MANDKRVYITVTNDMPENAKIEALSDKAFRCLITLWCWCSRNESDGKVPKSVWLKRTTPKARTELLIEMVEPINASNFYMHDYLEHQRSKAEIAALRATRAKAGSLGGKRSAQSRARDKWEDQQGAANA